MATCSSHLHNFLWKNVSSQEDNSCARDSLTTAYDTHLQVRDLKAVLFNVCTVGVIAAAVNLFVLGLFSTISLFVGGVCLLGRIIIEESFHAQLPNWVQKIVPNDLLKPSPYLSLGSVVVFYEMPA